MPEGDTVFRTARALHRAFAGRRLTASDLRVPQLAAVDLAGWTVTESVSRGKHLLLRMRPPEDGRAMPGGGGGWAAATDEVRTTVPAPALAPLDRERASSRHTSSSPSFSDPTLATPHGVSRSGAGPPAESMTLHSHLGMDGSWRVYAVGERWRVQSRHLIRAVLRTADAVAVGYQLNQVVLVPTEDEKDLVAHLGPDLLDPEWDPTEAVRRLSRRPATTIGEALRDQRNLAGIGNVYCCELLFLRGLWPWTPVQQVGDLPAVVSLAHRLLDANRARPTRSTTGSLRRGETTYVHGRAGAPCRRCGTTVELDEQAERVTYWCPSCQPRPGERRTQPGVRRSP